MGPYETPDLVLKLHTTQKDTAQSMPGYYQVAYKVIIIKMSEGPIVVLYLQNENGDWNRRSSLTLASRSATP